MGLVEAMVCGYFDGRVPYRVLGFEWGTPAGQTAALDGVFVPGTEDSAVLALEHSRRGKCMANNSCLSSHGQNYTVSSIPRYY